MLKITLSAVASLIALGFGGTSAQAQSRVFVAAQGADSNACSFAAPCRTFQHAHDVVAANGEIDVLDPAGYGVLTITKAISIQGHGFAGISVGATSVGIRIVATAADAVHLNGLLIDGAGVGLFGIHFDLGRYLTVENCIVRNMTNDGLLFSQASSAPSTQSLTISNSYFSDNGGNGIRIGVTSSGGVRGSIDRTVMSHNSSSGLMVDASSGTGIVIVAVADSTATSNSTGFLLQATGQGSGRLLVTHSLAVNNSYGVESSGANATLWVAQSSLWENVEGFVAANGGIMNSFGDNYVAGNIDDVDGTLGGASKR